MVKYQKFSDYMLEKLKNPEEARAFLELAIEEYENDNDTKAFLHILRLIAEAQGGLSKLAEHSNLNRQNLYKILSGKTTPRLDTALSIIKGLGFKISIEPSNFIENNRA
jgi:probable addiction module antidote protein